VKSASLRTELSVELAGWRIIVDITLEIHAVILTVGICTLQAHFSLSLSTSHPRSRSTRCPNC